jgi:hypothetical protein
MLLPWSRDSPEVGSGKLPWSGDSPEVGSGKLPWVRLVPMGAAEGPESAGHPLLDATPSYCGARRDVAAGGPHHVWAGRVCAGCGGLVALFLACVGGRCLIDGDAGRLLGCVARCSTLPAAVVCFCKPAAAQLAPASGEVAAYHDGCWQDTLPEV